MRFNAVGATALLCSFFVAGTAHSDITSDLAVCADERVKTAMLPIDQLAVAETYCTRVLEGNASEPDRQKAAFFRALTRFLQVVQAGMAMEMNADGSMPEYQPPKKQEVMQALSDVDTAIKLNGPWKGDALALRVTINQTIGEQEHLDSDIEEAARAAPTDATPLVQKALETERRGELSAALADLDRALELNPKSGPALMARARVLRRAGQLAEARDDLAAAAALGSPFRRLALLHKSRIEARMGDLRASFDDMLSAARETGDMTAEDVVEMNADLLVLTGNLALNDLKDTDTAESLFKEAAKLKPESWGWMLGLGQVEEMRGEKAKAVDIYRRILDGTQTMPNLMERNNAAWRLKRLTQAILQRRAGEFAPGFEFDVIPAKSPPDGLKRLALVIGSGNYVELPGLPNARRDATAIANRLADMGFGEVEIAEDVDSANLIRMPAYIAERAADHDIVVVFYAGHGVETDGVNYLIPVDAALESEKELNTSALALHDLTAAASNARHGALVIVDACRDDPFVEATAVAASRSAAGVRHGSVPERLHTGLAASPTPPLNNIVFHSTQPGKTAADGNGLDSPFVVALLQTLSKPGLTLDEVVRETSARVAEETGGEQTPTAYGTAPAVRILLDSVQD